MRTFTSTVIRNVVAAAALVLVGDQLAQVDTYQPDTVPVVARATGITSVAVQAAVSDPEPGSDTDGNWPWG